MSNKSDFWIGHLAVWRRSGLSQVAYCRCHGLILLYFGYWHCQLSAASARALLPIVMTKVVARSDDRIEDALPNDL